MRALKILVVVSALAGASQSSPLHSGLDLRNFDASVRPQDDLFQHVNGGWLARTAIPPDRVSYGTFLELADKTEADLRAIIEEVAANRDRQRGAARQIADLYTSLIEQERTDALGITPIKPELQKIDRLRTPRELAAEMGYLSSMAAGGPFPATIEEDAGDPGKPIVSVSQGGTLLPDRDYYLSGETRFVEIRAKYVEYLAHLFALVDRPGPLPDARAVLALETELARVQWRQEDIRNTTATPTKYKLSTLMDEMPGFDWFAWAQPQGIDRAGIVVLSQPSFFKGFAAVAGRTSMETWKAWLVARLLTASAPYLPVAFADARFEFFGRVLTGQELPRTHWKRGVSLVNSFLGDAAGRLYVEKHFPAPAKVRAERLVATLVAAFAAAITDSAWMSDKAKRAALDKLSRLSTKIGYPDRWRDYRGLTIKPDDLFGNVERAKKFDGAYKLSRLGGTSGRGEWLMTPQTVNAYYSAALNEVVVPAAMLQPPLFNVEADDAVNYGAIGAIVGHEIGHGFDERGRRFDGGGAVRNWWTAGDEHAFATISDSLVAQFNAYSPIEGAQVNGFVTLRENVGDLSGLAIAWRAYKMSLGGQPSPTIDGFTGEQRFFLGWAQAFRGRIRDEYLRQSLFSTPHAPPQFRVNGPVSNLRGFYEAFNVKAGDSLFREPPRRVVIW
jgi:putative endopeptidase